MENRIASKISSYVETFKDQLTVQIQGGLCGEELIEYIYKYEAFTLSGDDFQKRKRLKNVIPLCDRCIAHRIDRTQCSRRKQPEQSFCGTHIKGQPYGVVENTPIVDHEGTHRSQTVWCEDVNGIYYYIDGNGNVYNPEDVLANKPNPKIITRYVKIGDVYSIPEYFNT